MNNYELTATYVQALTGSVDTVMDWRCIHDQRKDLPAHNYRGTLAEVYNTLQSYNSQGYGVFCNINAMDGTGRELANVAYIRTHIVDLDNPLTGHANYEKAAASHPSPHFAVQTSPGKFHIYWLVEPYQGNDFYTLHQRKFRQLYDGDRNVIDATRVLRVPGFYHLKDQPALVTIWALGGMVGPRYPAATIQHALEAVNVIENFGGGRHTLGDGTLTAPSLDWLKFALQLLDPNDLSREEWVSTTAGFKQAGWNHADDATLLTLWQEWCAKFQHNDIGENLKLWNSIRDSEVGWGTFERRTPVKAYIDFGMTTPPPVPAITSQSQPSPAENTPLSPPPQLPDFNAADTSGEILDSWGCQEWFKGCYFIERLGQIFSLQGRFMDSGKFNGKYGGKHFVITSTGKTTDEAWKAALRSTVWCVPKVDHVRFLPDQPTFAIITDEMGRKGLNTYIPVRINAVAGDVTPWLDWLNRILPNPVDQKILTDYLAHCVKYPGYKIPWAPMLQSVQGIGKTIFSELLEFTLGVMYVYKPKAPELVKSGSTFNAWQRGKLMIVVDEIRVDEKRDLIEILKPMVTDARIEIQSKGVDQDMEDNLANWLFFSNYRDAIPINQNDRRFCIMYSAMQSIGDIEAAGMTGQYFVNLYKWMREGGYAAVAHWLLNYPIERGGLPVRAPASSSHEQALIISRGPYEVAITEAIEDGIAGFKGGYVSVTAAMIRCKLLGGRTPSARTVENTLETMGYVKLGRADRPWMQEDVKSKATLYGKISSLDIGAYGAVQGYN